MKELEISLPIFPPKKCISKDDSSNLSTVGLYIIQKLREEDLKEMLPSLSLDESNLNLENIAEELNSKHNIVELILNNRDILVNLDEFYEEECQLSLLNWAWNIHRKFFGRKTETNSTGNSLEIDTNTSANNLLNKELLFKNKCLNNKAEILLFNILNIFEIFPIKPDDLKSLNFIEKLRDIKKDMKSRNLLLYKKIKKLIKFWKKMINFFDTQRKQKFLIEEKREVQPHKFFNISLNKKRLLENYDTDKKDKNKRPNFISTKEDCENISSNISLDDTESGEHKLRKKNVSWKTEEFLVEKIEYDPMNAPFEI
jgi:hypothetical protein